MGGGSVSFGLGVTGNPVEKQNLRSPQVRQTSQPGAQWMPNYVSKHISNEMARDQVDPTCKEGIASVVDFNW